MKDLSKLETIYTHGGVFHADEAMACAILLLASHRDITSHNNITIKRVFNAPEDSDNIIIVDIGGGEYDHHFPEEQKQRRENGIPYAAAGLIWRDYGRLICSEYIHQMVDNILIMGIDAVDNGVPNNADYRTYNISNAITYMNPDWNEEDPNPDLKFKRAVYRCIDALREVLDHSEAVEAAKETVEYAIRKSKNGIMILDKFAPWQFHLFESKQEKAAEINVIIFPSNRGGYNVQMIPESTGSFDFRFKAGMPKEWRGETAENLQKMTGIPSLKFCHPSGFLCACDTETDAMLAAYHILGKKVV